MTSRTGAGAAVAAEAETASRHWTLGEPVLAGRMALASASSAGKEWDERDGPKPPQLREWMLRAPALPKDPPQRAH
eukprot:scaffold15134_cov101-Isochrysis_galbana.AAC.3